MNTSTNKSYFPLINKILLTIFLLYGNCLTAQIFINEFSASNDSIIADEYNQYDDWLELYNASDESIDVGGWYISDNIDNPTKYQIPTTDEDITTIPSGGFLLFWLDDDDDQGILHASFKLAAGGEDVVLARIEDTDTLLIDSINYIPQYTDISYGREEDGELPWGFFLEPTPNATNNTSFFEGYLPAPTSTTPPGFYEDEIEIELFTMSDGEIRYTLDGREPTEDDILYTGPFDVDETTVIKAAVFQEDYLPSDVFIGTYFIDENSHLPIISISTDPYELFSEEAGIYIDDEDLLEERKDWKKAVHLEYFDEDESYEFDFRASIKLFGRSAIFYPQKSFSVFVDDYEGSTTLDYQLFPTKDLDKFKSFLIRSSSDDWELTMVRDGFGQSLLTEHFRCSFQEYQPAILYINGEYFGINNLREKYNDDYVELNYGADPDNIDMLKGNIFVESFSGLEVTEGDKEHFLMMMDFVKDNDMEDEDNYEYVKTFLNVEEYIDYMAAEIYLDNKGLIGNRRMWRNRTPEGKWRFLLNDLDRAIQGSSDSDIIENNIGTYEILFNALIENEEFKNEFCQRSTSLFNVAFREERVLPKLTDLESIVELEMPYHIERWEDQGGVEDMDTWYIRMENMGEFLSERPEYARSEYIDAFDLEGIYELTTIISEEGAGNIYAQEVLLPPDSTSFTGTYFEDIPLRLEATPNDGYQFLYWTGAIESTDPSITINLDEDDTITAVFEEIDLKTGLFINEFMASNDSTIADENGEYDDWIELFNATNEDIDIGGMYMTDNLEEPTLWQIPTGFPDLTTIPAQGFLLLWADGEVEQGPLHVDFKLSTGGEQIGLVQVHNGGPVFIDSLSYEAQNTDISTGLYPDGSEEVVTFNQPTPNASNVIGSNMIEAELEIKVFLEGPFNDETNLMNTNLQEQGLLPLEQPYNDAPWFYEGTEAFEDDIYVPGDMVDWMLLELRRGTPSIAGDPTTDLVFRKAVILEEDGELAGTDGADIMAMVEEGQEYYVLLRHRNHLDIVSKAPIIGSADMEFDFSEDVDQALGSFQQVEYNEIACMLAANFLPDNVIQLTDYDEWFEMPAINQTYSLTDANLDGVVQVTDIDVWFLNKAKLGIAEIKLD